jgi:hypothetical protein
VSSNSGLARSIRHIVLVGLADAGDHMRDPGGLLAAVLAVLQIDIVDDLGDRAQRGVRPVMAASCLCVAGLAYRFLGLALSSAFQVAGRPFWPAVRDHQAGAGRRGGRMDRDSRDRRRSDGGLAVGTPAGMIVYCAVMAIAFLADVRRRVEDTRDGQLPPRPGPDRWNFAAAATLYPSPDHSKPRRLQMHGLIYLIGLIVVIMAILSFFGLR